MTRSTSQCTTAGIGGVSAGAVHASVFRPKIRSSDTSTFISILATLSALTFENTSETTVHQMHGSGNYSGTAINDKAKTFSFSGTYKLTVSPASVTAATTEVGIVGTLSNYFGAAGCSVSFDAFYAPEP
ncbi:MAG: hypothetical protein ACREFH_10570 [Stellaceae bacterium]